jgi:hypothetical protein
MDGACGTHERDDISIYFRPRTKLRDQSVELGYVLVCAFYFTLLSVQIGPHESGFIWSRYEAEQRIFGATGATTATSCNIIC